MKKLSYILIDIYQSFKCKFSKGHTLLDGIKKVEFNNILFIPCHIQPSEGDDFFFALRASGSDRELNIHVISHSIRIKLIPVLLSALMGRWRPKDVRTYEYRGVSIHTGTVLPAHADGESCDSQTDIQASYVARKVKMMI